MLTDEQRLAYEDHLVEAYLALGGPSPGAEIIRETKYHAVFSDFGHPMGNFAMRLRFADQEEASKGIDDLIGCFRRKRAPVRIYLSGLETPAGLARTLRQKRMYEAFTMHQMAMPIPLAARSGPECRLLTTEPELREAGRFCAEQFFSGAPPVVLAKVADVMGQAMVNILENQTGAVAGIQEGGALVSMGLAYTSGSVAGIFNVATMDRWRRKGFGTAITCRLLELAAAADCRFATLQAMASVKGMYEKLGFSTFDSLRCFVE
jgi:ribosomal protein S18 acetylase RimI-like enzyme